MARILVVDDMPEVRKFLRMILEPAGHKVLDFVNGAQGIGAFEEEPADIVFCDIFMPVKDGLATIHELRQRWSNIKVIAISGGDPSGRLDVLGLAKMLGAFRTLRKPFCKFDVLHAVDAALAARNHEAASQTTQFSTE
jgi:CheY-like chemotaxis protein